MTLLLQTAGAADIDFSTVDSLDPRANQRLALLLACRIAENKRAIDALYAQFYMASMLLATPQANRQQDLAIDRIMAVKDALLPHQAGLSKKNEVAEIKTLRDAWEAAYGKLDDPQTKREIEETVRAMRAMRTEKNAQIECMEQARQKLLLREKERIERASKTRNLSK